MLVNYNIFSFQPNDILYYIPFNIWSELSAFNKCEETLKLIIMLLNTKTEPHF